MNKQQLISAISEKAELTKKDTEIFLTAFTEVVMDAVSESEDVLLVGFGKFEKKPTKGTSGTIQFGDRKGEKWKTENSFKVGFSAGKLFSDKVKG